MNREELRDAVHKEWRRLHHNASLISSLPNFRNDYEAHLFWGYIGDEVSYLIRDLSVIIEDKCLFTLTFYSHGRGGATIAPAEWMRPAAGGSFGGCCPSPRAGHLCLSLRGLQAHLRRATAERRSGGKG